jgi:hypothetical protein
MCGCAHPPTQTSFRRWNGRAAMRARCRAPGCARYASAPIVPSSRQRHSYRCSASSV